MFSPFKIKYVLIIRPILRGKDIRRYGYEFKNLYLINTHNGIKSKNILPININDYPAIKKHLDKYWDRLSTRDDQGDTPYNLRNCIYTDLFFEQKIIYSEIVQGPRFFFDDENHFFVEATAFIMTGENIDCIIKYLNSSICAYLFKNFYAGGGLGEKGYRYKKEFLQLLPIPQDNEKNEVLKNIVNDNDIEEYISEIYRFSNDEKNFILNNSKFSYII